MIKTCVSFFKVSSNFVFCISLSALCAPTLFADSQNQEEFDMTSLILDEGIDPRTGKVLEVDEKGLQIPGLGWVPTGGPTFMMSPDCLVSSVVEEFEALSNQSAKKAGDFLQSRYSRCEKEWKRTENTYWSILKGYNVDYDYYADPRVRSVKLQLPGNRRVDGILALKEFQTPKPLVIYQCGLQCDIDSVSFRKVLMHLFDEGPFHVLILGSTTGESFQRANGIISAGGYDEGRQLYWIAKNIREGAYTWSSKVSEIHLTGFSLGGHSTLFASLYSQHNPLVSGPVIQSTFLGCAPVRLRKATENIYGKTLLAEGLYRVFIRQTKALYDYVPVLQRLFKSREEIEQIKKNQAASYVAEFSVDEYKEFSAHPQLSMEPFYRRPILDVPNFWRSNDMMDYVVGVQKPIFFLASKDDPVVLTKDNYVPLMKLASETNMQNLGGTLTDYGGHCDFDLTNDWQLASGVIKSFFISHSASLKNQRRIKTVPFVVESGNLEDLKTRKNEVLHSYEWKLPKDSRTATLVVRFKSDSWFWKPSRKESVEVPLTAFVGELPVYSPHEKWKRQQLVRWMNSELKIFDHQAKVYDGGWGPRIIRWATYR